jgi:hypothetical protein
MTVGSFEAQLNETARLLTTIGLYAERIYVPGYNQVKAADFRGLSYVDVWKKCYDNRLFDFRLTDDSLIQFRTTFDPIEISYAYYECPYDPMITLEQFMEQEQTSQADDPDDYDLLRQYELLTRDIKDTVTPLRYDYAPLLYHEGLHPASHIHFGHKNHIRIATERILKPLSFILFIVRQCYPNQWQTVTQMSSAELLCRNISMNLSMIDGIYRHPLDNWEMILT